MKEKTLPGPLSFFFHPNSPPVKLHQATDQGQVDIQKIPGHERATTTDLYLQSLGDSVRQAMGLLEGVPNESTTDEKEVVKPST